MYGTRAHLSCWVTVVSPDVLDYSGDPRMGAGVLPDHTTDPGLLPMARHFYGGYQVAMRTLLPEAGIFGRDT